MQRDRTGFESSFRQNEEQSKFDNNKTLREMGIVNQGEESAPPKQPITYDMQRMLGKLGLSKKTQEEITAPYDRINWFTKIFLTLQQHASENRHVQRLQNYVELVDRWYVSQMGWISRADETLKDWMNIGAKQNEALAKMIFEIEQMHYLVNDPGYGETHFEYRLPTEQEVAAIAQKHGVSEEGIRLYQRIQEDFAEVLNHIESISVRDAERTIKDEVKLAAELEKIRQEFENLRKKPYFPHARFGDYAIIAKNKEDGESLSSSATSRTTGKAKAAFWRHQETLP